MIQKLNDLIEAIARRWCYIAHPAPMWPMRGTYRCPQCNRVYAVPYDDNAFVQSTKTQITKTAS